MSSDSCDRYYSLTKHLALDEIIVSSKIVIFKQFIPEKHKQFGLKLCKLCDSKGYTYKMIV